MPTEPTLNEELLTLLDFTFPNWTRVSGLPIPFDNSDCEIYHCYLTDDNEFKFALAEVKGELRFAFGREAGKEKTAPLITYDKIGFLRCVKEYYMPLISYCPDYFNPVKGEFGRLSKLWNYFMECNGFNPEGSEHRIWIQGRIGDYEVSVSRNMISDDEGGYYAELLDNTTGDIDRAEATDPIELLGDFQDKLRWYYYASIKDYEDILYSDLPYERPAYTPRFLKKALISSTNEH